MLGAVERGSWEDVAERWAEHVRSGGDVPFTWNLPAFFELLPSPRTRTLDCGCGEGRVSRALQAQGHRVVGMDSSPTLIRLARESDPGGEYVVGDVADLPLADGSVDLVVSFVVLQDVPDHDAAVAETARVLAADGVFCFAIIHPVASAGQLDAAEQLTLDGYCNAFERKLPLHEHEITQYHRPLSAYTHALERSGFVTDALRELPTKRRVPGRYPMFLHVRARKAPPS
jgi:ubiquinone/menaquinone biosynthesis C-methylase UbiE